MAPAIASTIIPIPPVASPRARFAKNHPLIFRSNRISYRWPSPYSSSTRCGCWRLSTVAMGVVPAYWPLMKIRARSGWLSSWMRERVPFAMVAQPVPATGKAIRQAAVTARPLLRIHDA